MNGLKIHFNMILLILCVLINFKPLLKYRDLTMSSINKLDCTPTTFRVNNPLIMIYMISCHLR